MNDFEVWPGPMEGVGRGGFIHAVNLLKLVPRWMTPFFRLSSDLPKRGKFAAFLEPFQQGGVPVCVQLMGTDPVLLAEAGCRFLKLGAESLNLNFGCPSSRVVSGGAGGGALKRGAGLGSFCAAIKERLPAGARLSVKLRSGFASDGEMEFILPALVDCGAVDKIFFHYRTVAEKYSPAAAGERMRRFCRAVELLPDIPVVLNGDIASCAEGAALTAVSGAAGVMIARSWLRDPYLLRRFSDPDVPDAASGREEFFARLGDYGLHPGAMIELARMLWGMDDEHFKQLIREHGKIK